jgi:ribonuclease HI
MNLDNDLMINCDGLCEPTNPGGWACWAWLARSPKGNRLKEAYGCLGNGPEMTNNRAEYAAVLNALRYTASRLDMLAEREMGVTVYSDSQLIINQIRGIYRVNHPHLADLRADVVSLANNFIDRGVRIGFEWIPREQNADADALTRKAYQDARGLPADARVGEFEIPEDARPTTCRSCGAGMVFIRTAAGKALPLSLATVVDRGGKRYALAHFADCAQAKEWSKRR